MNDFAAGNGFPGPSDPAAAAAENHLLRAALRIGRVGCFTIAPAGRNRNDRRVDYLGRQSPRDNRDATTFRQWLARVHPDDRTRVDRELSAVLRGDTAHYADVFRVVQGSAGSVRRVAIHGEILRDPTTAASPCFVGVEYDMPGGDATEAALHRCEERFRAVAETSLDGFMVLESVRDPDGRIIDFRWLHANASAERIVGRPRGWFPGRSLLEEMPGNREAGLFEAYVRVVETAEPWKGEVAYRQDGVDAEIRLVTARVGDGIAVSFTDLSERRRAEERVRESEAKFRAIADTMPQMVWSTLPDGYHDYYNARWYEYTGVPAGSTDGAGWSGMFHPDDQARAWIRWRRSLATGEPYEIEYRLRRHDGAYRWTLGRALPIRDAAGRIIRWFGTCTDIHDQKEAAGVLERLVEERTAALLREVDERRRAEEALRQGEKLQAIGQLTGGIAHDFNNLLQVVSSGVSLLRMPGLTGERREMVLDGLAQAARNASDLTAQLLSFARRQSLRPETVDLNVRMASMCGLLRHSLGSRIRIETRFAADLWPVTVDPGQLETAVLNLAVNARDAMPDGGILTVSTSNSCLEQTFERNPGHYVCLTVADTGEGMTPAVRARIFEPFFTTKAPGEGTGLGLTQVHGFIKQSGGDIDVQSEPGRGTTIVLMLPRAPADAVAGVQDEERHACEPPRHRPDGRTILVVDDNPDVATFVATLLREVGYATLEAGDAAAALEVLGSGKRIDAVFSDIVMSGGVSGVELAALIARDHPGVAVVLATGYSEQLARLDGDIGIEVLAKPYRVEDLVGALGRALGRSEQPV